MRLVRMVVFSLAALCALAWARPASASLALGLGADYITDPRDGAFQLTLAPETALARHLTLGARFGVLYVTDPGRLGIPADLRLRVRFSRIYADGLVGPWIVFSDSDALKFHAAFGFGILTNSLSFGLEVGYLSPSPIIGLRIAFPL
jgi:hypothetical protein